MMSEQKCNGDHSKHMCSMMENKQLADIRNAAMNPHFMCSNSEENLCSPLPFDAIDPGISLE